MSFKAFVVRWDNKDPRNFVPVDALPSGLFEQATWARLKIKEVHVISAVAFVAETADKLRELMRPLKSNVIDAQPLALERRTNAEHAQVAALKHANGGFEEELKRHAK